LGLIPLFKEEDGPEAKEHGWEIETLSRKHKLPLCPTPESQRPLGARSVEQTILEIASKIELAIFVAEWEI